MSDTPDHEHARTLAERAVRQQQAGRDRDAEATFDAATELDPDAVAEVLDRTGANTAPDARDTRTDQAKQR